MASEISWRGTTTGSTDYFTIRTIDKPGKMWDTTGTPNFVTIVTANWANYAVAMSETVAGSYLYNGTFPAISGNMVAGWYYADMYKQAGGSPAISDTMIGTFLGYWDGTTFKPWADDTTHVGGTAQTARDLGASVLLSSGTGTGQLDFTSGVVKTNLTQILGAAITGTAALIVAAFTKFFNIATPTGTVNSLPDAVPGAANGLAIVGSKMDLVDAPNSTAVTALQSGLATTTLLTEVHGLVGKNSGFRNTVYDANNNLTSNDLCLYDSAAHATTNDGATGLLHKYSCVNTYDASNNLLTSVVTRVS